MQESGQLVRDQLTLSRPTHWERSSSPVRKLTAEPADLRDEKLPLLSSPLLDKGERSRVELAADDGHNLQQDMHIRG